MAKTIEYYFGLTSPFAYLGGGELAAIARRHDATVAVFPVSLASIFPVSGGLPLAKRAKQRQDYRLVELRRWSAFRNLPLNVQPSGFPADDTLASHAVIAARESGQDALAFSQAILRAVWAEERNIAEPEAVADAARTAGLDADSIMDRAAGDEIAALYKADTVRAIELGVFGSPTYFVDGEMFWGQDRLDFVDRKLSARTSRPGR